MISDNFSIKKKNSTSRILIKWYTNLNILKYDLYKVYPKISVIQI